MNQYEALMTMDSLTPEDRMALAQQYQRMGQTGAYLANSTIDQTAQQGGLMQRMAQGGAESQGLQEYRKMAEQNDLIRGLAAASGRATDQEMAYNKLSRGDRQELAARSAQSKGFKHLADSWSPEMQMPIAGGALETLNRYGVGIPFTDADDRATQYWSDYENWAADVRKNLYGSALTGYELKAWDKANVNSKMQPEDVRRFMDVRTQVMVKKAAEDAMLKLEYGHPPSALSTAYDGVLDRRVFALGSKGEIQEALRQTVEAAEAEYIGFLTRGDDEAVQKGLQDYSSEQLRRMAGEAQ